MERRYGIAAYDYWEGYSSCQIDLMLMDGPVIDYGSEKKKEMGNSASDVADMEALAAEYAKRKESDGSAAGKTFSMDDFVAGKV